MFDTVRALIGLPVSYLGLYFVTFGAAIRGKLFAYSESNPSAPPLRYEPSPWRSEVTRSDPAVAYRDEKGNSRVPPCAK